MKMHLMNILNQLGASDTEKIEMASYFNGKTVTYSDVVNRFNETERPNKLGQFYSNGKLLLTGEYVVLDGATALAVPTRFGQDLIVDRIQGDQLIWSSFTVEASVGLKLFLICQNTIS